MPPITPEQVIGDLQSRLQSQIPTQKVSTASNRAAAWINVYDRSQVVVAEPASAEVRLSMRDIEDRRAEIIYLDVRTPEDIDRVFPGIAKRAAWWASRLTLFRLKQGEQYVVTRAFSDHHGHAFGPPSVLTFVKQDFARYDGYYVLTFRKGVMTVPESGGLYDDLDLYLAPTT